MTFKIYFSFIFAILFIGGVLLIGAHSAQAITVGPVKVELAGDPGDALIGEFMVMNEGNEQQTYYSDFETYTMGDEGAGKKFLGVARDLATWIQTEKSVTLNPKEQKRIPFTVQIPQDAPAGSLFCVVWWRTGPPPGEEGQQLSIITQAGILMLMTVSGDIQELTQLKEFRLPSEKKFLNYFPPSMEVSVENFGNTYTKPVGQINISNIFGAAKRIFEVNRVELEVYPKTVRALRVTLPVSDPKERPPQAKIINEPGFLSALKNEWHNFGLGPYTADLNLTYGKDSPKQIKSTLKFYVIPWRILTIATIILILLLLFFTKGIKAYNRWIIRRAQKITDTQ